MQKALTMANVQQQDARLIAIDAAIAWDRLADFEVISARYRNRICAPLMTLLVPGYLIRCSPTSLSRSAHRLSTVACLRASRASAANVLMLARWSD